MHWRNVFDRLSSLTKEHGGLTYVTVGNLFSGGLGALFWLLIAKYIDQSHYGEANYLIAFGSIASSISIFGSGVMLTTKVSKNEIQIVNPVKTLVIVTLSFAALISWLILQRPTLSLLILADGIFTVTASEVLGRSLYRRYALLLIGEKIIRFASAFLLYNVLSVDGILLGNAIALLSFSFFFFSKFKPNFDLLPIKNSIGYILHNYVFTLSQAVTIFFDKLIIGPLFGFVILSIYQFAFQFLLFLGLIPSSIFQYLLPKFLTGVSWKFIAVTVVISTALSLLSVLFLQYFIRLIFEQYASSIVPAQIMSFGIVPLAVSAILNSKFLNSGRSKPVFISSLVYLFSQATLMSLLGTIIGVNGLAISTVLSLVIQSIILLLFYLREKPLAVGSPSKR